MPNTDPLNWLIQRLVRLIEAATEALETQYPDGVQAWEQELSRQLARYHSAAMLTGAGTDQLTPAMRTAVTEDLRAQLTYLARFGVEVQEAGQFMAGWKARAAMYARSIQVPYWRGATKMLPLPAMPAEGTQCLTNCKCQWEVVELDGENNYDAYWRRGSGDSCQTCVQREMSWSPVRIRDGVLQI